MTNKIIVVEALNLCGHITMLKCHIRYYFILKERNTFFQFLMLTEPYRSYCRPVLLVTLANKFLIHLYMQINYEYWYKW